MIRKLFRCTVSTRLAIAVTDVGFYLATEHKGSFPEYVKFIRRRFIQGNKEKYPSDPEQNNGIRVMSVKDDFAYQVQEKGGISD